MRDGTQLVCIAVDEYCVVTGELLPHPKIGEEVTVIDVESHPEVFGWLVLEGYPEDACYEPWNFKRVSKTENKVKKEAYA